MTDQETAEIQAAMLEETVAELLSKANELRRRAGLIDDVSDFSGS